MHTNKVKSVTIRTNITSHIQNLIQVLDVYLALHKRVSLYHNEPQESTSKRKDLKNKVVFSSQGCSLGD
jgi:hypothetical protein